MVLRSSWTMRPFSGNVTACFSSLCAHSRRNFTSSAHAMAGMPQTEAPSWRGLVSIFRSLAFLFVRAQIPWAA